MTGWQVLPVDAPDFEEAALRACELIVARDPRIGKVPGARRTSRSAANKGTKSLKLTAKTRARCDEQPPELGGPDDVPEMERLGSVRLTANTEVLVRDSSFQLADHPL